MVKRWYIYGLDMIYAWFGDVIFMVKIWLSMAKRWFIYGKEMVYLW